MNPKRDKSLFEREQYHSSGRLYWLEYLIGASVCVTYVFFASIYLSWSRFNSNYYIILTFVYTILPLAILVGGTVYWSHCHNVFLAAMLALPCCLGLWAGQYYWTMRHVQPESSITDLPTFIIKELITMQVYIKDIGGDQYNRSSIPWYYVILGTTADLISISTTTFMAMGYAQRAYCEKSGKWMIRETMRLQANRAKELADAFEIMSPGMIRNLGLFFSRKHRHTEVLIEYSPLFEGKEPNALYLTIGERRYRYLYVIYNFPFLNTVNKRRFSRREIESMLKGFKFSQASQCSVS